MLCERALDGLETEVIMVVQEDKVMVVYEGALH